MTIKRFLLNGYVIAVLATGATLFALQQLPLRIVAPSFPIAFFLIGVVLAAWQGGLRAGVFATALSTLAFTYFLVEPLHSLSITSSSEQIRLASLLSVGLIVSLIISQLLKAERRALSKTLEREEQLKREITERKQAEEALRERTELLERILATTDHPIFVKDAAGRYLMCNEALLRLLNAKVEDTLGRTDFEIFPRAIAQQFWDFDEHLLAKGGTERIEHTVRLPSGEQRLYLTHKTVYQDASGRPAGIVGVATDITERQQIEALLRERLALKEQLAKIAAHAPGVMYTYRVQPDGSACIPYAAPGIVDLYGVSPEELAEDASIILPLLHPDDVQRVITSIAESAHTLSPWRNEYRVRHPLKGEIWIEDRATPQADADGGITWYGFLHEVTERKRSQERLALVSFALNRVKEAAFLVDEQARFGYANDEACRASGYSRNELLRLGVPDIAPDWSLDLWTIHWRTLKARGSVTFEAEHRTKDGHTFPVEINANYFEYGGHSYNLALVRDISERKRAEERLREADRRKDEFLAMLGHELRNPLAPIRNAAQIMRKLDGNHPQLPWVRDMIERQVNHLSRLVDDLLDVSRIGQGKLTLQKAPVELATIIEHAIEASRSYIEVHQHTLAVSVPPEPMRVDGDGVRLTQVVTNLLNNAAKYTSKGGQIWLTLAREKGEAVISVRDTGEGIPGALLPHLFEVFTQAERTLDRAQGGLGLGLTIVRSIVELHGGRVEARSEGLGKGSEFIVRLPVLGCELQSARSLAAG